MSAEAEPCLDALRRAQYSLTAMGSALAPLIAWAVQEIEELEFSAALQRSAYLRGAMRWRAAHPGNELTDPDLADLCTWLIEQLEGPQA